MSYLGPDAPLVRPELDDAGFWAAANEGRFVLQRFTESGVLCHPPRPICPVSQSRDMEWMDAPQTGEVFSFTWSYAAPKGIPRELLPYNVSLIRLTGIADLRVISNVINATLDTLHIGAKVHLVWDKDAHGQTLPRFALTEDQT